MPLDIDFMYFWCLDPLTVLVTISQRCVLLVWWYVSNYGLVSTGINHTAYDDVSDICWSLMDPALFQKWWCPLAQSTKNFTRLQRALTSTPSSTFGMNCNTKGELGSTTWLNATKSLQQGSKILWKSFWEEWKAATILMLMAGMIGVPFGVSTYFWSQQSWAGMLCQHSALHKSALEKHPFIHFLLDKEKSQVSELWHHKNLRSVTSSKSLRSVHTCFSWWGTVHASVQIMQNCTHMSFIQIRPLFPFCHNFYLDTIYTHHLSCACNAIFHPLVSLYHLPFLLDLTCLCEPLLLV